MDQMCYHDNRIRLGKITHEIGVVTSGRPLGTNVHCLSLDQVDSHLFCFVLGCQAVLTSQIFEDGERLRQFHISVDVVRQLDTI